jgi:hypothetical protein
MPADQATSTPYKFINLAEQHSRIKQLEHDYADATVRIHQLELELTATKKELAEKTSVFMGVGDGGGNLFVYGSYEAIKAAQSKVLMLGKLHFHIDHLDAMGDRMAHHMVHGPTEEYHDDKQTEALLLCAMWRKTKEARP